MSLHTVAKHMAAKGRGPDSQLVHMSDREVAGLQAIARAHGGSLTINPETGLVEAGLLDKLMPAILGAGLAYATGGASLAGGMGLGAIGLGGLSNAAVIGGGLGLLQTARTGSLKEGIQAGLGAYGGASLGAGLAADAAVAPGMASDAAIKAANTNVAGATANEAGREMLSAGPWGTAAQTPTAASLGTSGALKYGAMAAAPVIADKLVQTATPAPTEDNMVHPYTFNRKALTPGDIVSADYAPGQSSRERRWFDDSWTARTPYKYTGTLQMAAGGPVEAMSNANSVGANTGYPGANIQQGAYATPWQTPISRNVVAGASDVSVDPFTGAPRGMAAGGLSDLGGYSDGGRLLKGPGDGVSDSIPAQIGGKQPARLADGEFVVPARIVSELGNGSTDAGARQLYKMMDRVQNARAKTTAKGKMAKNTNAAKHLPA